LKEAPEKGSCMISSVRDIASNPSSLQSTIDEIRKEAINIVKSTPDGLYTPPYEVLHKTDGYEIRKYSKYSICSTKFQIESVSEKEAEMADPLVTGEAFNSLASYIFGSNQNQTKLSMTTPVIIEKGEMQFVLSEGYNSANAPIPQSESIKIQDIEGDIVAASEFPGIATDGEVSRQRAKLEDALLTDGIFYDNLSFKVFQYNPPYTLPWLRRNEVLLKVNYEPPAPTNERPTSSSSDFVTAPEAGD
jgi:hypothetical protein